MKASETEFSSEMLIARSPSKLSTSYLILENWDKRRKVCGKICSSGVAKNYTPSLCKSNEVRVYLFSGLS